VTRGRLAGIILAMGILAAIYGTGIGAVLYVGWCAGVLTMLVAWELQERFYSE